jgi:hypothetical protein
MPGSRHSGAGEWERLKQIVKVEEPISLHQITRFCADLKVCDIDHALCEMKRASVVKCEVRE